MIESLRARLGIIGVVVVVTILWLLPNFYPVGEGWWFSTKKLNYGLDIQGGLHLVMGVDVQGVVKEGLVRDKDSLIDALKQKGLDRAEGRVDSAKGEIIVELFQAEDLAKAKSVYDEQDFATYLQIVEEREKGFNLRYYESYLLDFKKRVLSQAVETLRNRVDGFGVAEPSITAQGEDRILVQLPGLKDAERAKALINQTAKLEFWLVDNKTDYTKLAEWISEAESKGNYKLGPDLPYTKYVERLNADLKGKIPEGAVVLFEKDENAETMEVGKRPMVLTSTNVSGEDLKDAFVDFNEYGSPQVKIRFNPMGGKKFADLTGNNVGRQIAVVLDKRIKSAPNVQNKIPNGEGVITLGGGRNSEQMMEEAKMISTALRAGALPATLEQLEERTVGPTLGADSINKSKQAGLLGAFLVLIFMVLYYRSLGVIADLALLLNIGMIIAALTSLGATLTLPGIAGIVLTMGMAVDANVIIYERIKEELRKGSGLALAVKEGFDRAFWAIFDSNITTMATCVVLIYFGTGPVRGFGVTLLIGLVTSMFTAIFVTHALIDMLMVKFGITKVSIK